ncbi:MAG: hypothetical protein IKP60_09885 [Treponema sp.]|nr:hypothetical protein [Treponema sp.]
MKRQYIVAMAVSAVTGLMVSCGNFQMPESISVRTNAELKVPLGTATPPDEFFEKVSTKTLKDLFTDATKNLDGFQVALYDYQDQENSQVQNFLLRMKMKEPLSLGDFGDQINGLNLESMIGDSISFPEVDQTITAGSAVTFNQEMSIALPDFSDKLKTCSGLGTIPFPTFTEGTAGIAAALMPDINVRAGENTVSFDRIYYSSGNIKLTFGTSSNYSSDFELKVRAKIMEGSTAISESPLQDITKNQELLIPINIENGLPQQFGIKFDVEASGGDPAKSHTITLSANVDNPTPKKITNITANVSDLGIDESSFDQSKTVSLGGNLPSMIKSASFDDAKLSIQVTNPEGWSGIDLIIDGGNPTISGNGISSQTWSSTDKGGNYLINKEFTWGATLDPSQLGNMTVNVKPRFNDGKIENATIELKGGSTSVSIPCNIAFALTKIKNATVDLTELGLDTINQSVNMPEDARQYTDIIESITFPEYQTDANGNDSSTGLDGFGLRCEIMNTFPSNIPIHIQALKKKNNASQYYLDRNETIASGSSASTVDWTCHETIQFGDTLDFKVEIPNASNFSVSNITLGDSYSLKFAVKKIVCDWDAIKLDLTSLMDDLNLSNSEGISLPISIKELMSGLGDISELHLDDEIKKLKFRTLPMYLFAEAPSVLSDISFGGKLYMKYKKTIGDVTTTWYKDLLSSIPLQDSPTDATMTTKTIRTVDPVQWPENTDALVVANKNDTGNIAYYLENPSIPAIDMKDLFSMTDAEDIRLMYDISGNGNMSTIYRSKLEGTSELKIGIDMAMLLSLDFNLSAPIRLDVMKIANKDYDTKDENGQYKDLLNRTEPSSFAEYADYADFIEKCYISYGIKNELIPGTGFSLAVKVTDEASGLGKNGKPKEIVFKNGEGSLEFTREEIKSIMTSYPFHPNIVVQLGRDLNSGESTSYASPERFYLSREGMNGGSSSLSARLAAVVKMSDDKPITVWQK